MGAKWQPEALWVDDVVGDTASPVSTGTVMGRANMGCRGQTFCRGKAVSSRCIQNILVIIENPCCYEA